MYPELTEEQIEQITNKNSIIANDYSKGKFDFLFLIIYNNCIL